MAVRAVLSLSYYSPQAFDCRDSVDQQQQHLRAPGHICVRGLAGFKNFKDACLCLQTSLACSVMQTRKRLGRGHRFRSGLLLELESLIKTSEFGSSLDNLLIGVQNGTWIWHEWFRPEGSNKAYIHLV